MGLLCSLALSLQLLFLYSLFSLTVTGNKSSNSTLSPIELLGLGACNLVEISIFLRDLGQLRFLYMPNNSVKSLPSWMWTNRNLEGLQLSTNSLTGQISPRICSLKFLMHLDLSFNNLSGTIPSCLGSFSQALQYLSLQGNELRGLVPQIYLKGSSLELIDLSYN